MTDEKFKAALAVLAAIFSRPLDVPTLKGYELGLSDLSDEELARATAKALKTCKFMPSPSELRELAGAGKGAAALVAWDRVRWAMRKYGYTHSVDFGPLVNAVVRNMGGWIALDAMSKDHIDVWGKKEFERVYSILSTKPNGLLNGAPLVSSFPGPIQVVAIDGHEPSKPLGPAPMTPIVRELAESKSMSRQERERDAGVNHG
jgi:hypothetical protein